MIHHSTQYQCFIFIHSHGYKVCGISCDMHTDIHSLYINYQTHFLKDLKVTSQEGEWSSLSKFHKNKYGGQSLGTLEVLTTGFICM